LLTCVVALQAAPAAGGAALFKQKCSMCHGADGKGFAAIKTPDFTDPKWQASLKDNGIGEAIKNGKKGTTMPAFGEKLKDEEIQALVGYIRSFGSRKK
jgi:cbb3-type cytochrome c oxidase subunit III